MESQYIYDNIPLPEKVSDILEKDFYVFSHVTGDMLRSLTDPVKFSASASIFVKRGEFKADISLASYSVSGPALVNIRQNSILLPTFFTNDFDASFVVLSKKMTDAVFSIINQMGAFNIATYRPVVPIPGQYVEEFEFFYQRLMNIAGDVENPYSYQSALFAMVQFFYQTGWHVYERYLEDLPSTYGLLADKFLHLVRKNFKKERFLDFYAGSLEVSTKHLSRTVKSQTGVSPVEWIDRFIVLEAKVLLKSSSLNIQQISDELNFPSQSFFGKYFKKKTGMTPKEFRNH